MDSNRHGATRLGIDLHIHSTASDGTVAPLDILDEARRIPLGAVAITDHDTLAGVREVLAAGNPVDIPFLTGIEISISPPRPFPIQGSLHLLGYGMAVDDPDLNQALDELRQSRDSRNPRIITKLNALGIRLSYDDVRKEAGDSQIGRPHIATCLIRKGYAADINDAFNRYLGTGRPAYVNRHRIVAARAIALVRAAGGIPILAHPDLYGLPDSGTLEKLIKVLVDAGLMGIEVYYPGHSAAVVHHLETIAGQMDLLMSGGTDFHGDLKPDTRLGVGTGDFFVPVALYEKLRARLAQMPAGQV